MSRFLDYLAWAIMVSFAAAVVIISIAVIVVIAKTDPIALLAVPAMAGLIWAVVRLAGR